MPKRRAPCPRCPRASPRSARPSSAGSASSGRGAHQRDFLAGSPQRGLARAACSPVAGRDPREAQAWCCRRTTARASCAGVSTTFRQCSGAARRTSSRWGRWRASCVAPARRAPGCWWTRRTHRARCCSIPTTLDWSQPLLDVFGVARGHLPRCVPTRHGYGTLPVGQRRIALAACTGDQSAARSPSGRHANPWRYVNVGTGAFVQRVAPAGVPAARRLAAERAALRRHGQCAVMKARSTARAARSTGWRGASAFDVERALAAWPAPAARSRRCS